MALAIGTTFEIRTTGNANNGGGFFDRIPGTSVDYSQQNASQLSINDLVGTAANATVTSAAAGFTNAMVGNLIRIRGGANFTVGFYEIVQFNAANSVNLDRIPCTGAGANGLAEVGGAQIQLSAVLVSAFPDGSTIYIKNGTYAAHPAVLLNNGSYPTPIHIYGYDVARGDNPTGNNRPVLQMGANTFTSQYSLICENVRFEGSAANLISLSGILTTTFKNLKVSNLAVAGTVYCINQVSTNYGFNLIDCELLGTAGATSIGVTTSGNLTALNNYFHDLTDGIRIPTTSPQIANVMFNIFANVTNGISQTGASWLGANLINNSFSNCAQYGITVSNAECLLINNSFSNCAIAGIRNTTSIIIAKNDNFFNCGTPAMILALYPLRLMDNHRYVNPQFTTPGSNYSLQRTSGLIDAGFSNMLAV